MFFLPVFLTHLVCSIYTCQLRAPYPSDPLNLLQQNQTESESEFGFRADSNISYDEEQYQKSIVQLGRNGGVEGYIMKSILQRSFHAFEGIPYGESTSGELRFKVVIGLSSFKCISWLTHVELSYQLTNIQAPKPKAPWKGIRDAKSPGPDCAQIQVGRVTPVHGSEDCLYLNVYTPRVNRECLVRANFSNYR